MSLVIVLDKEDEASMRAARIVSDRIVKGSTRWQIGEKFPSMGRSVLFIGLPDHQTLHAVRKRAYMVAVLATHKLDIVPAKLVWSYGPTLEHAAMIIVGEYSPQSA